MSSLFPEFIQPILASPWSWCLMIIFVVFTINYRVLNAHQKKPDSFNAAIKWLKQDSFGTFYRYLLGLLLDKISLWIGDKKQCKPHYILDTNQNYKISPHNRVFSINPFSRHLT